MTSAAKKIPLVHYSDMLCVWAYVAQIRLDELRAQFHDTVEVRTAFCSVFGDAHGKLERGWRERGGVAGYRAHVAEVVGRFDHVALSADAWRAAVPTGSGPAHALVKAGELVAPGSSATLAWALRLAFFKDGRDISREAVLLEVASEAGLDVDAVRARLADGSALALVLRDYEEAAAEHVRGSPTFVLNEKRQTLYGNVGYKILEANVLELLRESGESASWC